MLIANFFLSLFSGHIRTLQQLFIIFGRTKLVPISELKNYYVIDECLMFTVQRKSILPTDWSANHCSRWKTKCLWMIQNISFLPDKNTKCYGGFRHQFHVRNKNQIDHFLWKINANPKKGYPHSNCGGNLSSKGEE